MSKANKSEVQVNGHSAVPETTGRKVTSARCGTGVQIGNQVLTSPCVGQKGIKAMELHPSGGVVVTHQSGKQVLITVGNLIQVDFASEPNTETPEPEPVKA